MVLPWYCSQQNVDFVIDLVAEEMRRILQEKDSVIAQLQQRVNELDLHCQFLEMAGHDGTLLWKIGSVRQRISDAKERHIISLYSQPFYAGRYGYKLCCRVYFNGDGDGYGTHVSLFFVVMRASKVDYMSSLALTYVISSKPTIISNSDYLVRHDSI